jgi:hypothetical protein
MKIVNLSEGLLTQGWMVSGLSPRITRGYAGLSATFFLKATFKLRHDELPVPWEKGPELISGDLMIDDDPSKGLGYASDYAPHKPQADFSAIGTAYPPPDDAPCFQVSMKVGTYSRQIQVWGERRFAKEVVGRSRAISEKPKPTRLSWDNAIGGPLSPLNTLGRGGDGLVMPLLEDPLHPTQNAPSKDILPAVFAPFPISHQFAPKKRVFMTSAGSKVVGRGFPRISTTPTTMLRTSDNGSENIWKAMRNWWLKTCTRISRFTKAVSPPCEPVVLFPA